LESRPVNQYKGRVVMTSKNREEITVRLNNGGMIYCENRGFKIGDEVCVVFDALNQNVIEVILAKVADILVNAGQDEVLSHVMQVLPENDSEFNDDILKSLAEEAFTDDPTTEDDDVGLGQDDEILSNQGLREHGIDDKEWDGEPEYDGEV
jgi:Tfp pilus assembly protein PilZ